MSQFEVNFKTSSRNFLIAILAMLLLLSAHICQKFWKSELCGVFFDPLFPMFTQARDR